jgi:quinol monooxygenase YgiN
MAIIIAGTLDFAPDTVTDMLRSARPLIDAALEEPGCRAYSWAVDPSHPGRVLVFEEWDDEASLAGHFAGAPYADMGAHLRSGAGILGFSVKKYRWDHAEPVYDENGTPRADFFTLA